MATTDFVVKNGLVVTENAVINETTDASDKDTGALVVEGGVGIEKKLYVGTDLSVGGATTLTGDLAVNGGDLTTSSTTATVFNTTATTVNFAGAATSVSIGAATGTTTINNANTTVTGDLAVNGGDLTTNQSTFNLLNTTATTVNFAGAATTLEIGAATGTTNINNDLDVDGDVNIDGGDLTVSDTTFNIVNTTATTVNFAGAATTLEIGAASGTTNINNNLVVDLDLEVKGGDLTTNQTTFNLINATATTVNIAGAGTTIGIGAATGTTTVRNSLAINGNTTIGDASGDTITVNSNTASVPNTLTFAVDDAVTNNISYPIKATHTTSGTPANGIGTGIQFITETTATNNEIGMALEAVVTDVTATSEDFDFVVKLMAAGAAAAERFRVNSLGTATLTGDLAVNGGNLTTNQTAFNLVNTTATTVNFAGAGTTVEIGAATGTTNVNNNLVVDLDLEVKGGDLTTNQTAFNLLNTTATTVNFAGAATTLEIGAATGTTNVNNNLVVDLDLEVKGGDLTTNQTAFNLLNTTATTVNFAGAATDVQIGAATGTTEINNNLNVVGDVDIDGGDLTVSTATFNLVNTNATTVNFAGAATTLEIGAATGTTNINNSLDVDGDVNIDGGDLTVSTGAFNLANTTATTVNFAGAGTTISIGAATGTTTINNANTVVTGDLAVNGADITTTSIGTATVFNANATTLNMGQAATTVSIGATTGTTTVRNSLAINGNTTIGDASGDTITVNSSTADVPNTLTFTVDDAVTNNIAYPVKISHTTSGTPANGIGTGIQFITETTAANNEIGMLIEAAVTDVTATSEDFDFVVKLMAAGAAAAERFRVNSVGNVTVVGDLAVNGGDITSSAASFNLLNSTVTTLNIGGAATTVEIGAATGTTSVNNSLTVDGDTVLGNATSDTVTVTATVLPGVVISGTTTGNALRITQLGTGNALVVEDETNPDATPFVVNASGQVGIGIAGSNIPGGAGLYMASFDGTVNYEMDLVRAGDNGGASSLEFRKTRGTISVPTIVSNGDTLANMVFRGYDGAGNIQAAAIQAYVDGTPGTNDMPGRLVFSTTADGASSPTEAMRINSLQNVGIGITSPAGRLHVANTYTNTSDATIVASAAIPGINLRSSGGARMSVFTNYVSADSTSFLTSVSSANPSSEVLRFNHTNGNVSMLAGNVGIGTATPGAKLSLQQSGLSANYNMFNAVTEHTNSSVAFFDLDLYSSSGAGGSTMLRFRKAAGTLASPALAVANSISGRLGSQIHDGAAFYDNALFVFSADGTPALNSTPGKIQIYTTPAGSAGGLVERMRIAATGVISLGGAPGAESLRVTPVTNAVNYLQIYGSAAGGSTYLLPTGTDTNIGMTLYTKGTSPFTFQTNSGNEQFRIIHTASAVNYIQATGSATGNRTAFSAQGSDTNVGINYNAKGAEYHVFTTSSGAAQFVIQPTVSAVNHIYVTGGVTGTGPTFSAQGSDTNINIRLAPKGTGTVQELYNGTYYDIVSQFDIGTNPNQIPLNQYLGTMAYQNAEAVTIGTLAVTGATSLGTGFANYLSVGGASSTNPVTITTLGSDTNVGLTITTKGTGAIIVGNGSAGVDVKGGSTGFRVWDDDSSHYYTFVTGNRSANYNINLPAGDVTLVAGTMITSSGGTFTGQLISTLANNTATGGGQLYLNGATGNRIDFNTNGTAVPAFTTRSVGTKIVLYPSVGATTSDYAFGIESAGLWSSVESTSANFKWYGGTTLGATLTGAGALTLTSNLTVSGGTITTGNVAATILGGNTTTNITVGSGLTSGTYTLGGTATTGTITLDQSNSAHTLNIATGTNASGVTKTINIGTGGAASSTTNITLGSAAGAGTIVANETITSGVGAAAFGLDFASSDAYISARLIRNNASATYNDGLYIGFGNTNSATTKLYGGGSTTVTMTIGTNGTASTSTTTGAVIIAGGVGITGALNATTKSFDIDHPTKPGERLRHGSLEGPEFGVYVRGRLSGKNIIQLPDYWTGLVDPDSITVNLTPIGSDQGLYVSDIVDNTVIVGGENVHCFYTVFAERKDVDKLVVEGE